MKSILFFWFFVFSFAVNAKGISFEAISFEEGRRLAQESQKGLFIDVYIDGCAPCKYLSNEVFMDDELAQFVNDNFISIRINAGNFENYAFKSEFQISHYPTLIYFNSNGELSRKIEGAKDAPSLLKISKDVVFPEQSVLFKKSEEYLAGNREKSFLQSYMECLKEHDEDVVAISREYIELHGVDWNNFHDLKMILYADLSAENPYIRHIFSTIEVFVDRENNLIKKVVRKTIDNVVRDAVDKKSFASVDESIEELLRIYLVAIDPQMTYEKLRRQLRTKFDDYSFFGDKNVVQNPQVYFQVKKDSKLSLVSSRIST